MLYSFEKEEQLIQIIEEVLSEFPILDDSTEIDLYSLLFFFSFNHYLPLVRSFPILKLLILFYLSVSISFRAVLKYLLKLVSILHKKLQGFQLVRSLVPLVYLVVFVQVSFKVLFPKHSLEFCYLRRSFCHKSFYESLYCQILLFL